MLVTAGYQRVTSDKWKNLTETRANTEYSVTNDLRMLELSWKRHGGSS